MAGNITSIKISSDGVWQGENPLHYAFPLLIIQTTLVVTVSRLLAFVLKPLHQPKVVAEIAGGILLGPSALGRSKEFMKWIFPSWSTPILESVASMGLLFFLFLVGLELDLNSVRRSGKKAVGIALAGISLPVVLGVGLTFLLRKAVNGADKVGFAEYFIFMGVSLSITAFPVLARILAELKLLTTQVGETAMAAAAFNDVAAWILLALAVAMAGNNRTASTSGHNIPLVSIWVLISAVAFVAFMLIIVQPAMNWVARRHCQTSAEHHHIFNEACICLTLAGVMVSGFMTDMIGIHAIFGAFVFGLTIPKDGEFAGKLVKRIEDFVGGLLLPLYFASSGLKTDVAKISGMESWGLLVLVISTASAGKILGTFVVAMLCTIPARESLALGVLMNTKGLVELIVLNIGKEKKVLNDEMFTILVIMALFATFMTTPTVMAIYRPVRSISSRNHHRSIPKNSEDKFRILACVHGPTNSTSLINFIESTRVAGKSSTKLYVMHLVELTDRFSSIAMVRRARKNGFPCISRFHRGESHNQMAATFEAYSQINHLQFRTTTAISKLSTMHEDIFHVAEEKRVTMIILPFKKQRIGAGEDELENVDNRWKEVYQRVLKKAPCSVTVLVDCGSDASGSPQSSGIASVPKRVCVVFIGGPDNREALQLGSRMAEHPSIRITVIRFVENMLLPSSINEGTQTTRSLFTQNSVSEKELDEAALVEFRRRWDGVAEYEEKISSKIKEAIKEMAQSRVYDLIIMGKGRYPPGTAAELADQSEHGELGPIGNLLASSGQGTSSFLVVQQHHAEKALLKSKTLHCKDDSITTEEYTA